jgi:uncharacterized CHY-type Zn-finger protein
MAARPAEVPSGEYPSHEALVTRGTTRQLWRGYRACRGVAMPRCTHCDVPIVDPTVQVVHGDELYCCANCAQAMEQGGSGSDPRSLSHTEALRCAHCATPIVDDSTTTDVGDQVYCCTNCAQAMSPSAAAT